MGSPSSPSLFVRILRVPLFLVTLPLLVAIALFVGSLWCVVLLVSLAIPSTTAFEHRPSPFVFVPVLVAFTAGFLSPLLGFASFAHRFGSDRGWFELHAIAPLPAAWVLVVAGCVGVSLGAAAALSNGAWHLRIARQMRILPRSNIRSVAVGLAEIHGLVRPASGEAVIARDIPWKLRVPPFYLEDKTGRILVNPERAVVFTGWPRVFGGRTREIHLLRWAQWNSGFITQTELRSGDPLYIIGYVRPREDATASTADSDALVIGPLLEPPRTGFGAVKRAFQELPLPLLAHDAQHVFFASDKGEAHAREALSNGVRLIWTIALSWIAIAGVTVTSELPRALREYSSWTSAELARHAPHEAARDALLLRSQRADAVGHTARLTLLDRVVTGPADAPAFSVALAAATNEDPVLRRLGARAIGSIRANPQAALPVLIPAMSDRDDAVRYYARTSLMAYLPATLPFKDHAGAFGDVADIFRYVPITETWPELLIREFGRRIIPQELAVPLFETLSRDPDPRVSEEAARLLAEAQKEH